MMILHGYPKLLGGPETWRQVGQAMDAIGFNNMPVFFGFLAGIIEVFCGAFLVFGLFFRPALLLLFIYMLFLTAIHIGRGDPFGLISHPVELAIVFLSLLFMGPTKYSLDDRLEKRQSRRRF